MRPLRIKLSRRLKKCLRDLDESVILKLCSHWGPMRMEKNVKIVRKCVLKIWA